LTAFRLLTAGLLCVLDLRTGQGGSIPAKLKLRFAGAQIRVVRDVAANAAAIGRAIDYAAAEKADVLLTPEGSLSGYVHDFDSAAVAGALEQITRKARGLRLGSRWGPASRSRARSSRTTPVASTIVTARTSGFTRRFCCAGECRRPARLARSIGLHRGLYEHFC
jgi:hypothetical protein